MTTPAPRRRVFILDTNVLMHDPAALLRFHEHDVFLPMVVLEELDAAKKGLSEVARNVRQVSRLLDELMTGHGHADIEAGLPLTRLSAPNGKESDATARGRLFFEIHPPSAGLPATLAASKADNSILASALSLRSQWQETRAILVSKDINLRIKAAVIGLEAQDYHNDQVLDDLALLPTGHVALAANFWAQQGDALESWQEDARVRYRVNTPAARHWSCNDFLHFEDADQPELVVRSVDGESATLETTHDFRESRQAVWGIHARNREQNFVLNLLLDPEIDLVTVLGPAGTGKTLLALAAGLAQTLDEPRYREIVMTRVTVPVGEDIGFLPGTEEEKMTPWMGALMDNLEVLAGNVEASDWERAATNELLSKRIRVRSLNFMRGRTFLHRYIILDEAQNLTPKQMKTLITRAGPGSKIVCLGNLAQIDTPYLTETSSGLTNVIDAFRGWRHAGHITLTRGERSRLADQASERL